MVSWPEPWPEPALHGVHATQCVGWVNGVANNQGLSKMSFNGPNDTRNLWAGHWLQLGEMMIGHSSQLHIIWHTCAA